MDLIHDLLYYVYEYEVTAIFSLIQELLDFSLYNDSDETTVSFLEFLLTMLSVSVLCGVNDRMIMYVGQ
jgi:hypothetical protein